MKTLRGRTGADFESEAIVRRGGKRLNLSSFLSSLSSCFTCNGTNSNKNKKMKYIVVKGPYIFVFKHALSSSPKYSIPLKHQYVNIAKRGMTQVVKLESCLGDVLYEFEFDLGENESLGRLFGLVLKQQICLGNSEAVKKVSSW